jgi:hypothetical protein
MTRSIALAFAFAALLAPAADAGGLRVVVGGGVRPPFHSTGRLFVGDRLDGVSRRDVVQAPPCRDHGGRWSCVGPQPPVKNIIVVPPPVYVVPTRQSCFVPGYWTYQWVPETTWYNVWVPGQYAPDWTWIEGHYEQRPYTTGHSQLPVWVPDRTIC